jgi:hypothetical protein
MLPSLYQRSASDRAPLRVGLLLDSKTLPRCFSEVVDHILQSNFASLELLIFNGAENERVPAASSKRSPIRKVLDLMISRHRRRLLLFSLYQRWDRRHIVPSTDPDAQVDCTARLANIESISVTPIGKRFVHRFPADAIELIRKRNLDVLIRFGFNILRGDILAAARYGIWSYHHGDGDFYRGGPSHFWEIVEQNPLSGVMLQVLTEELDAGTVLYKGWFATQPGLSRAQNCVQPYWGASTFVIQKLHELHQYGWEQVSRETVSDAPYSGKKAIYTAPTNMEMLSWLGPVLVRKTLQRLVRRPKVEHWRLAVRSGPSLIADATGSPELTGFRWIESAPGHFYADPFLMDADGRLWVFFEDFDYATNKGMISAAELGNGGAFEPVSVLERPYHLSYPCVFRAGSSVYMIPESSANGTVELYRCTRFPDRWVLESTLLELPGVDTTVWMDAGIFWLFVTIQEPRGFGIQLSLFSASTLTGKWTPHPANPISTDVRKSRGAGAIFRHNGKLFRPSQDCSGHYGRRFMLNEIVTLNGDRYEERACVTVDPIWAPGLVGTHTYSHIGQLEVIDGCVSLPVARVLGSISGSASK